MPGGLRWHRKDGGSWDERALTYGLTDYPYSISGRFRWTEFLEEHTTKELTSERDRIAALQGLINEMSKSSADICLHGVWTGNLVEELLWTNDIYDNIDKSTPKRIQKNIDLPGVPSWTWASVRGQIEQIPDDILEEVDWEKSYTHMQYQDHGPDTLTVKALVKRATTTGAESVDYACKTRYWYEHSKIPEADFHIWIARFACNHDKSSASHQCLAPDVSVLPWHISSFWNRHLRPIMDPGADNFIVGWALFDYENFPRSFHCLFVLECLHTCSVPPTEFWTTYVLLLAPSAKNTGAYSRIGIGIILSNAFTKSAVEWIVEFV